MWFPNVLLLPHANGLVNKVLISMPERQPAVSMPNIQVAA